MSESLLALLAVTKAFGPTRALDRVSFAIHAGEIHVLAGGNGAGKSTLIKILSGALADFEGELEVDGQRARLSSPAAALRAGVATIHQELSLVPSLSVLDNLFLGEPRAMLSAWRPERHVAEARAALLQVGLALDPHTRVEDLGLAERQLVEIARALRHAARVLILDEPTSALSEPEAERLFERLRELRATGKGIVFISHRMEEIFRLGDRITVLRDGRVVHSGAVEELDEGKLIDKMVGRALELRTAPSVDGASGNALFTASGFGAMLAGAPRPAFEDVAFELGSGEVLGLAGLSDSGASELLHALFGSLPAALSGELSLGGARYLASSPGDALRSSVTLLARDRKDSVLPERAIRDNVTLSALRRVSRLGFVLRQKELTLTARITERLALVAPSLDAPAAALSGGNQQKVALARCLATEPRVLLLDDPTRGIDVAAKADVHRLIRELAAEGSGVLVVSSDFDELASLCDRVLVLFRGRIRASLTRAELSRAKLLALAMGGEGAAA
ncbi:MAG: sugar ABC transporter ATP-binding protein [Myxococcales bacterium]|nr:sugar ABC transporter ATP-binding protein [Myxococcales bacterium]